jgi:DnaJ-class molecular chaperone
VSVRDYYAVLGVARSASPEEVRRAYRQLALQHHPDLAGEEATAQFQLIVEAYEVLSDPEERCTYDAELRGQGRARPTVDAPEAVEQRRRRRAGGEATGLPFLKRLCGSLDDLLAHGIARRGADGVLEVILTPDEARQGGTAAFDATMLVGCPTCFGLAEARRLWCRRCEFAGTVMDAVTVCVPIGPHTPDQTTFTVQVDPLAAVPPLKVRVRVAA